LIEIIQSSINYSIFVRKKLLNNRPDKSGRLSFKTTQYKLTIVVNSGPKTIFEKIWDAHVVKHAEGYPDALFIDRHFIHEVTSPQAFDGLRIAERKVRRPDLTIGTEDHNVPTLDIAALLSQE